MEIPAVQKIIVTSLNSIPEISVLILTPRYFVLKYSDRPKLSDNNPDVATEFIWHKTLECMSTLKVYFLDE